MPDQTITSSISGLDELEQRLREGSSKVARKVLRKAGKRGGEVIRAAIEQGAARHVETGFLEGHIVMKTAANGNEGKLVVIIGPQGDAGYFKGATRHGGTAEFKGEAHFADVAARMLEFGSKHQPPTPFMGPAFDSSSQEALDVFVDELWNALSDLAEK
jgi:HK97 gp10 family phage protein